MAWWRRQTPLSKVGLTLATVVVLYFSICWLLASAVYLANLPLRNQCEREADYSGYRGEQEEKVVDLCIEMKREYGM